MGFTNTTQRRLIRLCAVAAMTLCASHAVLAQQSAAVVHLDSGAVRGEVGKVAAFKGIPFAKPPVGALRWRPPSHRNCSRASRR